MPRLPRANQPLFGVPAKNSKKLVQDPGPSSRTGADVVVLRPYELRNRILLGDFYVYQPFDGKVFIEVAHGANAGEGSTFPAWKITQLIEDFYDKEF